MSVERKSYLLYGFRFDEKFQIDTIRNNYDELMEDTYSDLFNSSKSDQTIVFDGMCGEYVYVGINVCVVEEFDDSYREISINELVSMSNKLLEYKKAWPDYLQDLCKYMEPKLYFFVYAY